MSFNILNSLPIVISFIIITGCNNNLGSTTNNTSNQLQPSNIQRVISVKNTDIQSDLQLILDKLVESKDAKEAHITGIPLTFQCKEFNNNTPVSLATGKISDQSDVTLPIDAIYQIGSETKSFTAVIALRLASEGLFGSNGLDNTVGKILGNNVYPNWNDITLRQLLNMTSGIPNDNSTVGPLYADNPYRKFTTEDILALISNMKLDFTPGTNYNYSNTGYVLMNKIIDKVADVEAKKTGNALKYYITKYITGLDKLNLTHTYYVENIPENAITIEYQKSLLMSGYFMKDNPKTKYLYPRVDIKSYSLSFANAAGSIISDTADLHTYIKALFTPGVLLNEKELKELTTFVSMSDTSQYKAGQTMSGDVDKTTQMAYGLGIMEGYFELSNGQAIIMYMHEGSTPGFNSLWEYQKNGNASFTYTTNSDSILSGKIIYALHENLLEKISKDCLLPLMK